MCHSDSWENDGSDKLINCEKKENASKSGHASYDQLICFIKAALYLYIKEKAGSNKNHDDGGFGFKSV